MATIGPLLVAQEGKDGTFPRWLVDIGLEGFLGAYPIRQLVDWGWLRPQRRVIFPDEFFTSWVRFPDSGSGPAKQFDPYSLLWDHTWWIDDVTEPFWFLDPFLRPDGAAAQAFAATKAPNEIQVPSKTIQHNRHAITPYADFFYHWQGYALIDVIRSADRLPHLLITPDLDERAARMAPIVEQIRKIDPSRTLDKESGWAGLAVLFTWLSHYRAFRDALSSYEAIHFRDHTLRRLGARQLAEHLGVSAPTLSVAIKDRLLVLAQDWLLSVKASYPRWTAAAWPFLQQDVAAAVDWLCHLSGRTFDDFLDEWRYRGHFGEEDWAQLHSVLPYEFFSDRQEFLSIAPNYFKEYNEIALEEERFQGDRLIRLVDRLRANNYPFNSFLAAFRQLHEELAYRFSLKGQIDFRELRPLDHYSLLAIRAEAAFRYALYEAKDRKAGAVDVNSLPDYICRLAQRQGISNFAIDHFRAEDKKLTNLKSTPEDPIGAVLHLAPGLGAQDDFRVRAFLCCTLARNYFAHHYYLDKELLKSDKSAFMLSGILITALTLLRPVESS